VELQVVFLLLLQRLPALRIDGPSTAIRFKTDSQIVGVHALPVAW
jgi:hypothetical protein